MSTSLLQDLFNSFIHAHLLHLLKCFSITRTEGMCSLDQSFSSQWSRSHSSSKIAGKYVFVDMNTFG